MIWVIRSCRPDASSVLSIFRKRPLTSWCCFLSRLVAFILRSPFHGWGGIGFVSLLRSITRDWDGWQSAGSMGNRDCRTAHYRQGRFSGLEKRPRKQQDAHTEDIGDDGL